MKRSEVLRYDMKASEVLSKAADLLERDGWLGGGVYDRVGTAKCAGNAMAAIDPASGHLRGYDALSRHLAGVESLRVVWEWNDAPERTAAEVIETMRKVAAKEAERESQSAEVSE